MSKILLNYIVNREHHKYRKDHPELADLAEEFSRAGLCPKERMTRRFELLSKLEVPVLLPEEKICFMRTVKVIPDCFTEQEWEEIRSKHFIHELGYMSNLSPNYERVIANGLLAEREKADVYGQRMIDAIIALDSRCHLLAAHLFRQHRAYNVHILRLRRIHGDEEISIRDTGFMQRLYGGRVSLYRHDVCICSQGLKPFTTLIDDCNVICFVAEHLCEVRTYLACSCYHDLHIIKYYKNPFPLCFWKGLSISCTFPLPRHDRFRGIPLHLTLSDERPCQLRLYAPSELI